jgi:small GTP-binding protein
MLDDSGSSMREALRAFLQMGQSIMKSGTAIDPDDVPEQHLKMVLCGDQKTGKTKLYDRMISDTYSEAYYMTIGSDYANCTRVLPGTKVVLEVWDTAGNPQYRSILPIFFTNADIVAVAFDVTDSATFESIPAFVTDARQWVHGECDVAIFGTKIDSWKLPRQVTVEDAQALANRLNCRYFETSAVTTQGLEGALRKMIKRALKRKNLLPDWLMGSGRVDVTLDDAPA